MARRLSWKPVYWMKRWIYRSGHPTLIARVLNRCWAQQYADAGRLSRPRDVQLEVRGRRSGNTVTFPAVLADYRGHWYAVSMLGAGANWVHNVRAANGHAALRHGSLTPIRLTEVPVTERPPILKRYLEVAPGARPHFAIERDAPIAAFTAIASDHPVFLVEGYEPHA